MSGGSTAGPRRADLASLATSWRASLNGVPVDPAEPRIRLLVERLRRAEVRPADPVVLDGLRDADVVRATVAAWLVDAVPMPLSARSAVPPAVSGACRITEDLAVVAGQPGGRAGDLAETAVLHTSSGSTARPKVAQRGVRSVLVEAEGYRVGLSLTPDDTVAVPLPLAHSLGWGVTVSALLAGCGLHVDSRVRPGALAAKADAGVVSVLALTAPLARLLALTRPTGSSRPRAAMVGAGPVTDELEVSFRERFGRTLVRGYGSTETGGTFLGTRGLGAPVSGVEILRPSPGEQGELVLRLAAPVEGYLDDTAEPSRTWSTGDAVRRDRDGVVHFVSRLRGGLRLNGRFIDTDVAEQALRSTPGVRDVLFLVLPRRHTPEIEDLYAVVEGDHGRCDTVLEQLARRAPEVPLPHVVGCARVPRNVLGKPDRYQLIDAIRKEYPVA